MRKELKVDALESALQVSYYYQEESSDMVEFHGYHEMGGGYSVDLKSVDIFIDGSAIDILPFLSERQKNAIIKELYH